ncbi:MAG: hypothetical protein ACYTEK_10495 [Planctomycetota bacterium]|jgi:rubrerythrin
MDKATKHKLVTEFETMRLIEQDARDFYIKASQDQSVEDQKVRSCFTRIAEDEQHHIELVDRIINTLKNCL